MIFKYIVLLKRSYSLTKFCFLYAGVYVRDHLVFWQFHFTFRKLSWKVLLSLYTSHKIMLILLFTCTRIVLSCHVLYLEHICGFFGDCDHNLLTLHYVTVCKSASKHDTCYAWIDCYFYCDGRAWSYDLFFVVYLLNFLD